MASSSGNNWQERLNSLDARLNALEHKDLDALIEDEEHGEAPDKTLRNTLFEICKVVHEAHASNHTELPLIVEKAGMLLDRGVDLAYGMTYEIDFLESFADMPDTMVKDTLKGFDKMGARGPQLMRELLALFGTKFGMDMQKAAAELESITPDPWSQSQQPHAQSSKLSRFRANLTFPSAATHPLANLVYQARCEVMEDGICAPADMALSSDGSCLAVLSCGGWKQRDPVLEFWSLGEETERHRAIGLPLSETAHNVVLDSERKLMFVGDSYRIKSFSWKDGQGAAVHTMNSSGFTGPLAVLPDGRALRAGKGSAAVWNIDELETHGRKMKKIGKGRFDYEGSWRDLDTEDDMEFSTGTKPHNTAPFSLPDLKPLRWHMHRPTGHMICAPDQDKGSTVVSLDLEHGGAVVARYLGHGGSVLGFSTSDEDANLFATAGSDGYARLYDVRSPLPSITFDIENRGGMVGDVVFTHIDGLPTLFTGGSTSQCVKLWDIRAKQCMYELSTGNNAVSSLAWNPKNATLYAATECEWVDRMGYHHDYRRIRRPAKEKVASEDHDIEGRDEDGDEDEEDYDDDDDDWDDEERYWPQKASHDEDSFGYLFDIGEHALFHYTFKENADPDILPAYGQAQLDEQNSYW